MARLPDLARSLATTACSSITVADLIAFRIKNETLVHQVVEAELPSTFGEFRVVAFENALDHEIHIALVKGTVRSEEPVLVRVHTQSTLGDVFESVRSESGRHLRQALEVIDRAGAGVVVYLRQEGRGLSLIDEIRSYSSESALKAAPPPGPAVRAAEDLRTYGIGAQILRHLGVRKLRLLTSHPKKIVALHGYGLSVVEQIPLEAASGRTLKLRME